MNRRSKVLYKEKLIWIFLVSVCMFLGYSCESRKNVGIQQREVNSKPKIVNIVNFIRLLEPRDANITEDVLYQTVVNQVKMMKEYNLGGTFLLQYDALLDSRYQKLLKELPKDSFEIGAWWEIPKPMAEKAGLKWRGRFPWDWHADVGFSTGYTPEEREKLADVYMNDFKEIFGYYPKSVASWFIDAHTLNYLYEKYDIVASANCKDQYGTDGYTMWGGYWNQAYYPSKINSYMPAQNMENQIPVPIFRMLGSDPLRQYDTGLGHTIQGVITLEPVYTDAGGDENWVKWYLDQFINGESMEYAYTQAGQENSFTWNSMKKGFEIQLPLISKLRDENKVIVETLEESGKWFKKNYKVTPATSVVVENDNGTLWNDNRKTVWFNSRFYRANLLWDQDGTLKFRDIHLFDENLKSTYFDKKLESNQALFFTLPIVDGYLWSKPDEIAGLRFKEFINGKETLLEGGSPTITNPTKGKLVISWPLKNDKGSILMEFDEKKVTITYNGDNEINWFLDLTTSRGAELPFKKINSNTIDSKFENTNYSIKAEKGDFSVPNDQTIFRITPRMDSIVLDFSLRN
ncbi:DUF3863 domain-containing protein [Confluentibacter sediminis]|uniref:DUF3863 domain-containing protein n=1 Tax=Confluentibacter sediminis TaxID=2219045 RepID=UPI000DADECAA|nr:DUF3863 domain-containing protein [Confluentibacter sediminis]